MEKKSIQSIIDRLESEIAKHDSKFAGDTSHQKCVGQFATTLKQLKEGYSKCESSQPDMTARGDELENAKHLEALAALLENEHHEAEAELIKQKVRGIVAKELNELDGFDR